MIEAKKPEDKEVEGECEMCGNTDTLRHRYGMLICRDCERLAKGWGR